MVKGKTGKTLKILLGEENTSLTKEVVLFKNLLFSILIFFDENNIAKLVGDL